MYIRIAVFEYVEGTVLGDKYEWTTQYDDDGKPDVKSNAKLLTLEGVLKDFGWSREARAELLYELMEQPSDKERLMKKVIK